MLHDRARVCTLVPPRRLSPRRRPLQLSRRRSRRRHRPQSRPWAQPRAAGRPGRKAGSARGKRALPPRRRRLRPRTVRLQRPMGRVGRQSTGRRQPSMVQHPAATKEETPDAASGPARAIERAKAKIQELEFSLRCGAGNQGAGPHAPQECSWAIAGRGQQRRKPRPGSRSRVSAPPVA